MKTLKRLLQNTFTKLTGYHLTRSRPNQYKGISQVSITDLLALLVAVKPKGLRVLQIGAYDGISFDPVYPLLSSVSADIVLVEPNREAAKNLRKVYPQAQSVEIVEAAIVEKDER